MIAVTVQEIFNCLCRLAPLETALSFDNPGLLVGDAAQQVKRAVVCLDCTTGVIEQAVEMGAQLIITHHPVLFTPLKAVTENAVDSRVYRCVQAGISVISMHTNLDSADGGVNDCLAAALGLKNMKKIADAEGFCFRAGMLAGPLTAKQLALLVQKNLNGTVRYTGGSKTISCVAVCGGSGADQMARAIESGADALVTADVRHNYFIEAIERDFTLIDAGHYKTENTVIQPLCKFLQQQCGGVSFTPVELPLFDL